MTAPAPTPPADGDLREFLVELIDPPVYRYTGKDPIWHERKARARRRAMVMLGNPATTSLAALIADAAAQRACAERAKAIIQQLADTLGHALDFIAADAGDGDPDLPPAAFFVRSINLQDGRDLIAAAATLDPQDTPASDGGTDARHT